MVSYFYFFEIFSTQIFCGKYFGGLCMLSASDRREAAAQIFEIQDILLGYQLTEDRSIEEYLTEEHLTEN